MRIFSRSKFIFLILCTLITVHRFTPKWGASYDNGKMIMWDCYGYYLYLPAFFIYDDPGLKKQEWITNYQQKYNPSSTFYQVLPAKNGGLTIKYSMGTAILWSPFFFVAHALAENLGYPADGLSPPYSWALVLGGLIYAFIGLWFLRKVLLRFFTDGVTSVVLVLITMGTNYWAQTASETMMPHSTLFALNCVIFWLIIKWHESKLFKHAFLLGILMGLAAISRPTEIFWVAVFLLWNVTSWSTLKVKLQFLLQHRTQILLMCVGAFIFLFMQTAYWKFSTGDWVSYTYQERFSWKSPYFVESFFSFKKGWFIYTPLMIFAFWGFYFMWKLKREVFWASTVFVFINTWMIMSWECWWYASCFSNRALLEMYPAMAIPLGYLITHLSNNKSWYRIPTMVLVTGCVVLNMFQIWQFNHGIIDGERMTAAYYWKVFLKTSTNPEYSELLEIDRWSGNDSMPDPAGLKKIDQTLYSFDDPEQESPDKIDSTFGRNGGRSFKSGPTWEYGPAYRREYWSVTDKDYAWVHASVWISIDDSIGCKQAPPFLTFVYETPDRVLKYTALPLDTAGIKPGEWRKVEGDFITPNALHRHDRVGTNVWNISKANIHIDDFKVEMYEPLD